MTEAGSVMTLRSMDWKNEIKSNISVLPRGMARDGAAGPDSQTWTSRYGSVASTAFDIVTADGMNEAGLVVSTTRWRTVPDHANLRYSFESTLSRKVFWRDVNAIDLSEGAPVRTLPLTDGSVYAGAASASLQGAAPFDFEVATP